MKMKRIIALVLSAVLAFSFAACAKKPAGDNNKGTAKTSISVCLASEPDTIDPALNSAVDGATLLAHLFSGLAKWQQTEDGKLEIVPDAATELPEGKENKDGTVTYTYTLKDGLKWSDGKPVTANDFVFAWQRAASLDLAADYGYMFEVVDGYDEEIQIPGGPLAGMSLEELNDAMIEGVINAHRKDGIPLIEVHIPELTPFYFGQLVYFLETTCAITAMLTGVNPFNQPGVEAYKKEMRKVCGLE